MRVLVCGGRHFNDRNFLFQTLDQLHARHPVSVVIHGDAPGADRLAGEWATARGITVDPYPADWNRYGRRAGPIRNTWMLNASQPAYVVAFSGGSGTDDMVTKALAAGLPVWMQRTLPTP